MLQGGAAFVAFGALTLAAASPAHADTYGWAYASALGGHNGVAETYITQDQTVSNSFSNSIGDWLTVEGTTTATVNASGATGTAVVDTARIVITEADLPGILDPDEEDEDEDEEDGDTEDDGTEEDDEGGSEDDEFPEEGDPGDAGDGDGESGTGSPGDGGSGEPGDPSSGPTDEPTEAPVEEPAAEPTAPDGEDEDKAKDAETASADVIELDEENSELVGNGDAVLLEATVNGASVSTSQSWDGGVSHDFNPGSLDDSNVRALVDDEEIELLVSLEPATAVFESEDAGFVWNDAVTDMYITFSVGGEVVAGYSIAESAAGITTGVIGDGGDGGGDGKNPPQKERDKDTLPTTDAKDAEPLAQTGSPLAGLIAAGAAITAGGGAAAYLARRKKKNNEEAAEAEAGADEN